MIVTKKMICEQEREEMFELYEMGLTVEEIHETHPFIPIDIIEDIVTDMETEEMIS